MAEVDIKGKKVSFLDKNWPSHMAEVDIPVKGKKSYIFTFGLE